MTAGIHASMIQPHGRAYRDAQIVDHSHYRDPIDRSAGRFAGNSRVWGDASPETQSRVIDTLIESSRQAGLNARQTAHVLAIARVESGFNPDAAAGTTSASGLGQFVDRTGNHYGLNDSNRFDLPAQANALVAHYIDNLSIARSRGQGEEHVYKYHHDGPTSDYGGLAIARAQVTPYMDQYETFVRRRIGLSPDAPDPDPGISPGGSHTASRAVDPRADGVLRRNEHGQPVRELQQDLNALGYDFQDTQGRRLAPTGFYGAQTHAAVRDFQGRAGLPQTGFANEATLKAISDAVTRQRAVAHHGPVTAAPATQGGDGPRSFEDVMRTMLPPNSSVAPHITSDFGHRLIHGRDDDHGGIDFNYRGGQNGVNLQHPTVRSPVSGEVVFSGGQYGTVKIRDDHGNMHEILHLDTRSVQATHPPQRVEAGTPIGTMGGRGPGGGDQYAQHVHYQMRNPQGQLIDPERFWDEQHSRHRDAPRHQHMPSRTEPQQTAFADGRFGIGDRGVGVEALQRQLDAAGYRGRDGVAIAPDARFGPDTGFAVSRLQERHGIPVTGEADMTTLRALGAELAPRRKAEPPPPQHGIAAVAAASTSGHASHRQPPVTDSAHPDHAMYRDILGKVHLQDRLIGRTPDSISEEIAAGLTVKARSRGMERVGFIAFSQDGSRVFMADTQDPTVPWALTAIAQIGTPARQSQEDQGLSPSRIEPARPSVPPSPASQPEADPDADKRTSPRMPM